MQHYFERLLLITSDKKLMIYFRSVYLFVSTIIQTFTDECRDGQETVTYILASSRSMIFQLSLTVHFSSLKRCAKVFRCFVQFSSSVNFCFFIHLLNFTMLFVIFRSLFICWCSCVAGYFDVVEYCITNDIV